MAIIGTKIIGAGGVSSVINDCVAKHLESGSKKAVNDNASRIKALSGPFIVRAVVEATLLGLKAIAVPVLRRAGRVVGLEDGI